MEEIIMKTDKRVEEIIDEARLPDIEAERTCKNVECYDQDKLITVLTQHHQDLIDEIVLRLEDEKVDEKAYETGYREGGLSTKADFDFIMDELYGIDTSEMSYAEALSIFKKNIEALTKE